jgi:tetratricopeptide (TPR) repeat protein
MEIIRLVPPLKSPRLSFVRMGSPPGPGFAHRSFRVGLIATVIFAAALSTHAGKPAPVLFNAFVAVDARALDDPQAEAVLSAFEALAREASPCGANAAAPDRSRCVVDALFASGQLATVAEPGDPESSTITSALVSHRGNCAALTALALAVTERAGVPMEVVVFPRHVVVRAPGDDAHVFELLNQGATLSMAQLRKRLGADGASYAVVRPGAFPAYYLDNLAVRLAEAGDGHRAEAMFETAIEAGPRVSRIRFNYGTYLLGKSQLEPAEKQLRRAVRLEPKNAPAWANLGVVVAKQGDTAEARRCFERALQYEPGNRVAAENLKALNSGGAPPRP